MDVAAKLSTLALKTPERQRQLFLAATPERQSIISPGLPMVGNNSIPKSSEDLLYQTFPPSPQAGMFSVMVPNRIFVGGFSPVTTEHELRSFFEKYGNVREVKIIRDDDDSENGGSKKKYSYGFVTFMTDREAKKVVDMNKAQMGRAFKFQGRYLNVNEAIKKPPASRLRLDTAFTMPPASFVLRDANGMMTVYPGYTIIPNSEPYPVIPAQNMVMPSPMIPVYVQPPQPMYSIPATHAPPPMAMTAPPPPAPVSYAQVPAGVVPQMCTPNAGPPSNVQPPQGNYY